MVETASQQAVQEVEERGIIAQLALVIALLLAGFHLVTGGLGQLPDLMQRSVHVCGAMALGFLISGGQYRILSGVLAILASGVMVYLLLRYEAMSTIGYFPNTMDVWVGGLTMVLVLEAARRVVGLFLPCLAVLVILYALFGYLVPGQFGHRGMSLAYLIEVVFGTTRGLWGVITGVSATVIATFVIFGAILFRTGGGETFMNLSLYLSGRQTAGAGKVATIASGFFGSLSGSAAANIATTGAFTIPMMKRLGFSKSLAAGVEASASMGGQLMPPIMGAGAFVMAELLATSYGAVALAALIPAILFYLGVFLSVHLYGARHGHLGLPKDEIPRPASFLRLKEATSLFVPLGVLVGLMVAGFTPGFAGFWAIISAVVAFSVFSVSNIGPRAVVAELGGALVDAGRGLVTIAVLIACAQIILALVASTGLGVKVSQQIVSLGASNLFLSLVLAMILALILGMGLPTTAAYLLAATVLAPALEKLGINGIQAHLFIFYFAIAAGITPPLCAGVFIAASMAGAKWTDTLLHALRISFAALPIPYLFVAHPALLMEGPLLSVIWQTSVSALAILASAVAYSGYLFAPLSTFSRLAFAMAALCLYLPYFHATIAGVVVGGLLLARQKCGRLVV